jgi:hypothetical protein
LAGENLSQCVCLLTCCQIHVGFLLCLFLNLEAVTPERSLTFNNLHDVLPISQEKHLYTTFLLSPLSMFFNSEVNGAMSAPCYSDTFPAFQQTTGLCTYTSRETSLHNYFLVSTFHVYFLVSSCINCFDNLILRISLCSVGIQKLVCKTLVMIT